MRARITLLLGGTLLSGVAGSAVAQGDPTARASWLAGCWEARSGERVTLEMWMAPAGGVMIGGSRTTAGAEAREFEHLRIGVAGGRLVYTAIPSGQREAAFPATTASDTLLVFENVEHDFPQRIIYRRRGADSVVARVEGPGPNNTVRGFDIPMRRVSCTAPAASDDPGPATLVPGDPRLQLSCGPVTDTLELIMASTGQAPRVATSLIRTRQPRRASGSARCLWAQRYLGPQSFNVDTTTVDAATLAPIEFAVLVAATRTRHRYAFTADSVTTTVTPPDSAPRITGVPLRRPVFLATAEAAVLEALPLSPGLSETFDLWRPPRGVARISIVVQGVDTLRVQGRPLDAWRVAWDDGTARSTYWIARAERRLVRSRTVIPSGEFWRLVRGDSIPATR